MYFLNHPLQNKLNICLLLFIAPLQEQQQKILCQIFLHKNFKGD